MVLRNKLGSQYVIYIKGTLLTLYLLQFSLCPNLTDKLSVWRMRSWRSTGQHHVTVGSSNHSVCSSVLIGSRGYHSFPAPLPFVFVVTSWEQKYIEELSWLKPDGLDLWSFFLLGYKLVSKSSRVLLSLTWDGFNFAEIIFCCSLNPIGSLSLACCCVVGTCLWVLRRGSPSQERHYP